MRCTLALGGAVAIASLSVGSSTAVQGTCGYQCTDDSQCGGCGTAGKCSCPDGKSVKFFQESCSCVSAPANPPASPTADIKDSAWPEEWTADTDVWCYSDFSDKTAIAQGKFYYNAALGRSRADWHPYINGKDAHQVWVGSTDADHSSTYYVKSGLICLKFPITDPGQLGTPAVGIEKPDWMSACGAAGYAHYVGREQVTVTIGPSRGEDVWADHYSCRLDYEAANQSITFQNWHSLGLGSVPKGLPVRVTGGNSVPKAQTGSPRMNTVWYSNFTTGQGATKPSDFDVPDLDGKLCIPVASKEVKEFFGHDVKASHAMSPAFHRRAHFLPHATASASDLRRARRPKPGAAFAGDDFESTMRKLNAQLQRTAGLRTVPCSNFTVPMLHEMQRLLFDARTPELDSVYRAVSDNRRMAHGTAESLEAEQARHAALHHRGHHTAPKARDGACHEMVMWFIHHLSESAREAVKEMLVLPLLPEAMHEAPAAEAHPDEHNLHSRYTAQVSCAICHVVPTAQAPVLVV